jgi:tRNA pseudouridine32 synthase/23S rRNA pseudouridine746 synthase
MSKRDRERVMSAAKEPPEYQTISKLLSIPHHLRISIKYSDDSIAVIFKPSLLRSVPGNMKGHELSKEASHPAGANTNENLSMQQAWTRSLSFYDSKEKIYDALNLIFERNSNNARTIQSDAEVLKSNTQILLSTLASKPESTLKSIPRRCVTFKKYVAKNRKSLLPHLMTTSSNGIDNEDNSAHVQLEEVGQIAFDILSRKTHGIYTQSISFRQTPDEASALGQLNLLAIEMQNDDVQKSYGSLKRTDSDCPFFVVHRLDCETSGVMVFARTADAASKLSKAWREREAVSKVYLARVKRWPPFEHEGNSTGRIQLPLAASDTERLKWEVRDEMLGGKPSHTEWNIFDNGKGRNPNSYITLELKPVTGRTHQLRVHCAAIGSGILGDSLYGDDPITIDDKAWTSSEVPQSLRLHSMKLSFPHPETNAIQTFNSDHCWKED